VTLLSIISNVVTIAGISNATVTQAIGSADSNIRQLVALSQDVGDEIARRGTWRNLNVGHQITGDGLTTLWILPADFASLLPASAINGTFVSLAYPTMPLRGPVNDEELNMLKALPAVPRPSVWRLIGQTIEFWPALAAGEVVTGQFRSNYWILQHGEPVRICQWSADDDVALVPEKLIELGTIWRWLRAKGLDYGVEMERFETALQAYLGQENTGRTVATARGINLPQNFWGGTISVIPP